MILFFYNCALLLALVVGAPWWLLRMAMTQKYREGLWERLGRVRAGLGSGGPLIWVHAVSVGEVLAVSRLVKTLDANLPQYRVAISTTTRTGQALARERFGAERVFYCPLDLPWAVGAYLKALRPAMLVLAETEFWPNLLAGCERQGIPVVVVNARISDRSWPRYWRLRGLWRPFLSRLTAVLAQSQADAERLRALGCAPERVTMAGNVKFDVRADCNSEAVRLLRAQSNGLRLMVAGSTLEGEETLLLGAWPEWLRAEPKLAMVLAPRHPERFAAVAELLERSGVAWQRRSGMDEAVPGRLFEPGEIVLLDSMGELASVYSLAVVAFVGGSLLPAGGHNPLEPAQFGVPVVMGESYENFRGIVEALRVRDAVRIVKPRELARVVGELLQDSETAAAMGSRGLAVYGEQAGATDRAVEAIRRILLARSPV